MTSALLFGLCCALIAVVYACVLPDNDTPLNGWFRFLSDWHDQGGPRSWLASPLGGCVKCTAGQLALWSYSIDVPWSWHPTTIFLHVVAASSAVLCAQAIAHAYRWMQNRI